MPKYVTGIIVYGIILFVGYIVGILLKKAEVEYVIVYQAIIVISISVIADRKIRSHYD